MAYPHRQSQDKFKEKRSDAIRVAWKAFSEEAWRNRGIRKSQNNVQMSPEQLETLFLREARRRWLKVLKENEWDAGAWMMMETDEEEVSTLLNWTRDELVSAADEDWGIFVNPAKFKNDMMSSGPEPKRAQPVVPPQPMHSPTLHRQELHAPQAYARPNGIGFSEHRIHAQLPLPQQSLAPPPVTQSPYARPSSGGSSRVRHPHSSRSYRTTSSTNDEEEEGGTSDSEEEEGDDNGEEEEDSYDVDEGEDSDDVTEVEDNDQDRTTNRVISGTSGVSPFPLIEPFYDEMPWVDLETNSPKTASFASKSAYEWMGKCHRRAAKKMMLISELRLAGRATKQKEERLILEVERYCRRSHKKWRRAVDAKWAQRRRGWTQPLTGNEPHVLERGTMPRVFRVRGGHEGPGLSQRPQWDYTDDLSSGERRNSRASSLPKARTKRGGRVPRTIFEQLEPVVRERIAAGNNLPSGESGPSHANVRSTPKTSPVMPKGIRQPDPVRGESSRRPTLRRSSTSAPSHPMRALSPMWYNNDEEAIVTEKKTKLTSWGPVPYEYEKTALPQNGSISTRSSAFMLAEEGGERYRPARHDEEETSDKRESDWDTDISSESSFAMTEASFAHFAGSGQRGPTDEHPGKASGINPDWFSAQRAARGAQVLPRSGMTDVSSVSSFTMTEASFAARSGQPGPSNAGQYAPGTSNTRERNLDQLSTQRSARASRALPRSRMS